MPNNSMPANLAPRLVGRSGEHRDQEIYLKGEDFLIGRSFDCHLVLNDSLISARHAKIIKTGEQYELLDLNSTNGTYVNNEKIEKKTLRTGDRIKFGLLEFEFLRPIDVSRTIVATTEVLAGLKAMESARHASEFPAPPSPPSSRPAQAVIIPPARQKGGLWSGLIPGVLTGLLIAFGLPLFSAVVQMSKAGGLTVSSVLRFLQNWALGFPGMYTHEGWKIVGLRTVAGVIVLLGLALGPFAGGRIARRGSRRGPAATALAFAIAYGAAGLVIQVAVLKLAFSEMALYYPGIVPSLGRWGNMGVVLAYFAAVVFVLGFGGTLLVRSKASQ
jgi:hypothetical protein